MAYLGGGPRCDVPPLARPWKFLRRLLMKRCVFCRFPAKIAKFNNVWWSFFIPIQYAIKIAMWDCIWYDAVIFCVFEFQKKWANLRLPLNIQKQKVFQLRPLTPDQGLCPWTPLGALPSDPRYRLALCALAMPPPFCQVLHTPLPTCILERDRNELEKQHLRQQRWSRTFQ